MDLEKNHSPDMALIDITDKISQTINNNLYFAGIFIDLSKVFDTADHIIMLSQLILFADDTNSFKSSSNLKYLQQKLILKLAGLSC